MIIDNLSNAGKYESLHPMFKAAFNYLRSLNLERVEPGKTEVDGEKLKSIVSEAKGVDVQDSVAKFECHNQYIDIQLIVSGKETFGWKPRSSCSEPKGEYNEEKDVMFYNDAPDTFFSLRTNQFVIFYPEDVHAPGIGSDIIKKIVLKVRL